MRAGGCLIGVPALSLKRGVLGGRVGGECAAVQLVPRGARRLVVVDTVEYVPHARRVASSLEGERQFSEGCWHALRLFHRTRRTGACSQRAEGLGSVLAALWDPVQGLNSGALVERLMLKAADFRGDGSDDFLVRAVARCVKGSPHCTSGRALRRLTDHGRVALVDAVAQRLRKQRPPVKHDALHTTAGQAAAAVACCGAPQRPRTVDLWCGQARIVRKPYDLAVTATSDIEVLRQFAGCIAARPSLPTITMGRVARQKLATAAQSVQKRKRREAQAAEAQAKRHEGAGRTILSHMP